MYWVINLVLFSFLCEQFDPYLRNKPPMHENFISDKVVVLLLMFFARVFCIHIDNIRFHDLEFGQSWFPTSR